MPKDIRSYFTSLKTTKKVENVVNTDNKANRKRKKTIVLSDSDDEPVVKSPKNVKKKVPEKITTNSEETSKYFEINKQSVHKQLGDAPVKRTLSLPKFKQATAPENHVLVELDDAFDVDDDWEMSVISENTTSPEIKGSSEEIGKKVDSKKRKINSEDTKEVESLETRNPECKNSVNQEKQIENGIIINKTKIESPIKQKSPLKPKTPSPKKQQTPSPQKCITSYYSPKKNTSPRFDKLNITRTPVKLRTNLNDMFTDKPCKEIATNSKESKTIDNGVVSKVAVEHILSSDSSDNEIIKDDNSRIKKPSSSEEKSKKVNANHIEHSISPDNSDDEEIITKKKKSKNTNKTTVKNTKKLETKTEQKQVEIVNNLSLLKPDKSLNPYELWVEKYRPVNLKNIIGQQGEKSCANKLFKWLKKWFENHDGKKKHAKPSFWDKDGTGAYFKAALLSGPPGIGKTTTAHVVCKELNMDVVEFNASDTRSKKLLNQEITELLSNKSLSPFMQGAVATNRQHVLIMDEVDGMAGNEDRGGVQELISLIKNTKIPIICMCNDRNHPKIRSLGNYCYDLRFFKPRVEQIKGAMLSICFKEKLKIKPEVLTEIIASTNQDIRLVLNHLSVLSANKEKTMNITDKEIKLGPWDVLRKVFSHEDQKKMSIHDRSDLFFHDYSIAPLFVQENYLRVVPYSAKGKTKREKMELFAKAADSLCYGDMVDRVIRSHNVWSLLPAQAIFSSVVPGHILSGHVGGQITFPVWFGKNSKKNKMDRLGQEIQQHTRLKTSASKEAITTDYAYAMRDSVAKPLLTLGVEGIDTALKFLHDYSLLREDITSLSELTSWEDREDPFSSLDSKVKASFTRAYNKNPVLPPLSIPGAAVKKGRKGNTDDDEMEMLNSEEMETIEESDQESDDPLTDGMIIKKRNKEETVKKERNKKETPSTSKPRGGKKGKK